MESLGLDSSGKGLWWGWVALRFVYQQIKGEKGLPYSTGAL